jgi:uncharacterized protein (TIGR01244 family)
MMMNSSVLRRTLRRTAAFIAAASIATLAHASGGAPAKISKLTDRLAVSGQITPEQLAELKAQGYTSIVALRPDGESPDQPTAAQMRAAADSKGMKFAYVPVVSGAVIPETAVASLARALDADSGKVLMYCRSGSRAARTWSLVEASRQGGADPAAILASVKASGQSADDLRAEIAARATARANSAQK